MNHTHIALLALLLPFSGLAITKEERKKEVVTERNEFLLYAVIEWVGVIAGLDCVQDALSRLPQEKKDEVKKFLKEYKEKMEELETKYEAINAEQA